MLLASHSLGQQAVLDLSMRKLVDLQADVGSFRQFASFLEKHPTTVSFHDARDPVVVDDRISYPWYVEKVAEPMRTYGVTPASTKPAYGIPIERVLAVKGVTALENLLPLINALDIEINTRQIEIDWRMSAEADQLITQQRKPTPAWQWAVLVIGGAVAVAATAAYIRED